MNTDSDTSSIVLVSTPSAIDVLSVYDEFGQVAFSLAFRLTGNRLSAENLIEAVFLKSVSSASFIRSSERHGVRAALMMAVLGEHRRSRNADALICA